MSCHKHSPTTGPLPPLHSTLKAFLHTLNTVVGYVKTETYSYIMHHPLLPLLPPSTEHLNHPYILWTWWWVTLCHIINIHHASCSPSSQQWNHSYIFDQSNGLCNVVNEDDSSFPSNTNHTVHWSCYIGNISHTLVTHRYTFLVIWQFIIPLKHKSDCPLIMLHR